MLRTIFLTVIVFCLLAVSSFTAVPQLINYQGFLRNASPPKNPVNGIFDITFKLYDDSTGGSNLWTETLTGVVVDVGNFSVLLGSMTPFAGITAPGNMIWLGITVEADPEISPRNQWVSVPFAFQAARADTAQYAHQTGIICFYISR